ncbi:MAG: aspartate kinase [Chloroflexota bacterium]
MKTLTMKFGGTSVGSVEAISNVVEIVRDEVENGNRVVIVVSAMGGVTDMLLETVNAAVAGDKWEYQKLADKIRDRHEDTIEALMEPGEDRDTILKKINKLIDDQLKLCEAVGILGERTDRIMDGLVSFGERLSSRMMAAIMREYGVNAKQFDATKLLLTNDNFQDADPIWDATQARIENHIGGALQEGFVPVITGFIGSTADGITTTLGRGGSDYSAAIMAAYSGSDELIIWTDVDGVMTTDPRIDDRAQVLPTVSYQEVGELAFYGAKVLHPKTVQPIIDLDMPVRVRNTFNPSHPGTLIRSESEAIDTINKAVTVVRNVSLLTVGGRGMIGVPGIAGRAFGARARAGASILMISQSSSEQSFCFTVPENKAVDVRGSIETELTEEIHSRDVDSVVIQDDIVIITAVGSGMRGTPGIAGRVFTVMGDNGVNVLSIAQGSSECSISFIVSEADTERAVVALHDLALETVRSLS